MVGEQVGGGEAPRPGNLPRLGSMPHLVHDWSRSRPPRNDKGGEDSPPTIIDPISLRIQSCELPHGWPYVVDVCGLIETVTDRADGGDGAASGEGSEKSSKQSAGSNKPDRPMEGG